MRVLIASDKFKDSLTAGQACAEMAVGVRCAQPTWSVEQCPLTDGGEGFAVILTEAVGGEWVVCRVTGPRGAEVEAGFGVIETKLLPAAVLRRLGCASGGQLAVIEMAAASGLALLRPDERDVWRTDTRGTGELIAAAAERGVEGILLGVGGSATSDLGLGALGMLGLELCNEHGQLMTSGAPLKWPRVVSLKAERLRKLPPIWIACDVTNPLLGPRGAVTVYGPQKGLESEALVKLEAQSARMMVLLCASCGVDAGLAETPGAGAAGGIAFGLMAATGARLVPGFELVSDWLRVEERLAAADLVITGEGRFDDSSLQGKGPGSLVRAAVALGKPVHVFAGRVDAQETPGVTLHEVSPRDVPLAQALAKAGAWLRQRTEKTFNPG
ncbi:glycerate kinase [Rariglobus hedericola]|uniref:Glycerate kinase n=1 Tax=Rariglobus hedericola TaxID=2597822 RepID=A0A556QSJ3_9BACT|nr:glycerate kinase [Rariglobus hedericola]TSJ79617.1 glycerate kinase [Rariglobus hedericola]